MITSDPKYSPLAEVHVPQACESVADFRKGCLFPEALNFDPDAVQSGPCEYPTEGCMEPGAYNFNPAATEAGVCIHKVTGCSLDERLYVGLDNETAVFANGGASPENLKFAGGLPLGLLPYGHWNTTLSTPWAVAANTYVADATEPDCVVAVEGCMDPTAVNYDSRATTDNGNWCIAKIEGCMAPTNVANSRPDATVNVNCIGTALGCTSPAAANFNPKASQTDGSCIRSVVGCGNPRAINYDSEVTDHRSDQCIWTSASPSPPAPPLVPFSASDDCFAMRAMLTYSEDIEQVQEVASVLLNYVLDFSRADCGSGIAEWSLEAGSAIFTAILLYGTAADARNGTTALQSAAERGQLSTGGLSAPQTLIAELGFMTVVRLNAPPAAPPSTAVAIGVGAGIGVLFLVILLVAGLYALSRRRKKFKTVAPNQPSVVATAAVASGASRPSNSLPPPSGALLPPLPESPSPRSAEPAIREI